MAATDDILGNGEEGASAQLTASGFTTAEIQKGFATKLRVLRQGKAAGINTPDEDEELEQLEFLLEERTSG